MPFKKTINHLEAHHKSNLFRSPQGNSRAHCPPLWQR